MNVPLQIEMGLVDLVRIIDRLLLDEMGVQQIRVRVRAPRNPLARDAQRNEARNADPAVAGVGRTGWEAGHGEIPRLGTAIHRVLGDIDVESNNELIVAAVPLEVVTQLLEQGG